MSLHEKDYIKRMIERLAEAVAALAGATKRGEDPLAVVQAAGDDLFPGRLSSLDAVDAASALLLLPDAHERRAYAGLCRLRAEALEHLGRAADAERWRVRAGRIAPEA